MQIELKNGKIIDLDWNPIIFEYLSDYENGIEGMKKDITNNRNLMYIANHIVYSVISANIDEDLPFKKLISLIKVEDIDKIIDFVNKQSFNMNQQTNSKEIAENSKKH